MQGDGLRARVVRGSGWTLVGFGAQQLIRMVSTLILTRLLFPEVYGLMAMAGVYLVGLQMFSDIGIRHSIIQNTRGLDPKFLNTAWTVQVARGFLLWLVSGLIAYPVSVFYEEPVLFPILVVLGLGAAIRGFQSTAYATANRELRLGKLSILEFVTQIVSVCVTIAWAKVAPSVWALAGGGVISTAVSVLIGFRFLPTHRHRIAWDPEAAKQIFGFGKWIFVATVLGYFANNGDKLILGKFMTAGNFGLYGLALTWAMLAVQINNKLGDRVMLAVYAGHQDADPGALRPKVAMMRLGKGVLLLPIVCFFIIFGSEIISFLYDVRYHGAGWMLQVLSAGVGLNIATHIGEFYLARGRSRLFMGVVLVRSIIMISSMSVGGYLFGSHGIVYGVAATNLLEYPMLVAIYRRFGLWIWQIDLALGGLVIAAVAVAVTR